MTKAPWKSKNLITRLRWWGFKFCGKGDHENIASDVMCDAADRIEKLEAALRKIKDLYQGPEDDDVVWMRDCMTYKIVCDTLEGKDN